MYNIIAWLNYLTRMGTSYMCTIYMLKSPNTSLPDVYIR